MLTVVITEKGGEQQRREFHQSEVTIGRVQGNDIVLPKGNVSKRHSRIVVKDGKYILVDLKSTNGTYVNGRKISSPLVIKSNDKIYIGDFILAVQGADASQLETPPPPAATPPPMSSPALATTAMTPELDPVLGLAMAMGASVSVGGQPVQAERKGPPPIRRPASDLEPTRNAAGNDGLADAPQPPVETPPPLEPPHSDADAVMSPSKRAQERTVERPIDRAGDRFAPERTTEPPVLGDRPSERHGGSGPAMPATIDGKSKANRVSKSPAYGSGPIRSGQNGSSPLAADAQPGGDISRGPDHDLPLASTPLVPGAKGSLAMQASAPAATQYGSQGHGGPAGSGGNAPASGSAGQVMSGASSAIESSSGVPASSRVVMRAPLRRSGGAESDVPRSWQVGERLVARTLQRVDIERLEGDGSAKARQAVVASVESAISQMREAGEWPAEANEKELTEAVVSELIGLGPLEALLEESDDSSGDTGITKIFINRFNEIFVEEDGKRRRAAKTFMSEAGLVRALERLLGAPLVDHPGVTTSVGSSSLHGIIDKLLPEGLRVLVVLGPHAVRGPCAVITKPRRSGPSLEAFTASGLLSEAVAETLRFALRARRNILVTGPNPELILQILAALGRAAPEGERVIAVSERAPFDFAREDAILLQAQPPELSLRRAVQGALQMVADRLIVSDLRGGEIFDLISAMPRGREAILVGMQAPSRLSALQRMESLVLASGELPAALGRELVATAMPLVLEVAMAPTGRPRLEAFDEVDLDKSGKQFALTSLFSWKREGGSNQTGVGRIIPSGTVPSFCDELKKQGISVPASLFRA